MTPLEILFLCTTVIFMYLHWDAKFKLEVTERVCLDHITERSVYTRALEDKLTELLTEEGTNG